jgi:hypothetical protein
MESKKQTAIEWLQEQFFLDDNWKRIFEQAKEMHKGEIIDAHGDQYDYSYSQIDPRKVTGEQYYNETFAK